jgi:hypothetical protein
MIVNFHLSGQSDSGGTTVSSIRGSPANRMATVTATITGTNTDKIFIDIEVSQG